MAIHPSVLMDMRGNDMQGTERVPQIGEIYLMKFDGLESEQGGIRPGLVFQNNMGNLYSPNIIALPLTSRIKKASQPTHVFLPAERTGLIYDSIVLAENPQRMSKNRVLRYITTISNEDMARVASASILASSAISYLGIEDLTELWKRASYLNSLKAS